MNTAHLSLLGPWAYLYAPTNPWLYNPFVAPWLLATMPYAAFWTACSMSLMSAALAPPRR